MQDNTITLAVDAANDGNPTDVAFTDYRSSTPNRSDYIAAGHTPERRHMMQLYRTAGKRSGVLRGVNRTTVKFTIDREVPNAAGDGTVIQPEILEIIHHVPVGCTPAQTKEVRQYGVAFLDDDTLAAPLNDVLEI